MNSKHLTIVFSWPRAGTHLLWSKIVEKTNNVIAHDFPVIPLMWHSVQSKRDIQFIPNLENPWKDNVEFNISQNYAFFANSSSDWENKNKFHKPIQILNKISINIGYEKEINKKNIEHLYSRVVQNNRSNNLLLINRFPYTSHYQPSNIIRHITSEWNIDDAIKSTELLLEMNEKVGLSTRIICVFPEFKNFYFKRSAMFTKGNEHAFTDYLSITHFINYFKNNNKFNFIQSSEAINACLKNKNEDLLEEILKKGEGLLLDN